MGRDFRCPNRGEPDNLLGIFLIYIYIYVKSCEFDRDGPDDFDVARLNEIPPAEMTLQAASLAGAALVTTASYVNARYGVGADIRSIRYERNHGQRIFENIARLGETCTLYNLFSSADPTADALWFEGRKWKYRELKHGMCL